MKIIKTPAELLEQYTIEYGIAEGLERAANERMRKADVEFSSAGSDLRKARNETVKIRAKFMNFRHELETKEQQ